MKSPDPAKIDAHHRRMALRRKYRALCAYTNGDPVCTCCSESRIEFLAIDHVEGGGNQHRKAIGLSGGHGFYAYLAREGFPSGYRVLCHNCNSAIAKHGYCPHTNPERAAETRAEMLTPRRSGRLPKGQSRRYDIS
jgi:hypothetical protein